MEQLAVTSRSLNSIHEFAGSASFCVSPGTGRQSGVSKILPLWQFPQGGAAFHPRQDPRGGATLRVGSRRASHSSRQRPDDPGAYAPADESVWVKSPSPDAIRHPDAVQLSEPGETRTRLCVALALHSLRCGLVRDRQEAAGMPHPLIRTQKYSRSERP